MNLFGTVLSGLDKALEFHETRHRVIAENIANAETPGYRARRVEFDEELRQAFDEGVAEDGASLEAEVDRSARMKADRNTVDLDTEMAKMSENTLRTVALSRLLSRKYGMLKAAITGVR